MLSNYLFSLILKQTNLQVIEHITYNTSIQICVCAFLSMSLCLLAHSNVCVCVCQLRCTRRAPYSADGGAPILQGVRGSNLHQT